MMSILTNKNIIIVIMGFIIASFILFEFEGCKNKKNQSDIHEVLSDSLHKTINKLGQEIATKKLLYATVSQLKSMRLDEKDSLLKIIKNTTNSSTISSTALVEKTIYDDKIKTIVEKGTKEIKGDTVYMYPIYRASWDSKWRKGNIYASKDSVECRDTIINQLSINTEYIRDHFWTSKYPVVSVLNSNPHTKTIDLANFTIDKEHGKQSRFLIFLEGIAVGFIGYKLLLK